MINVYLTGSEYHCKMVKTILKDEKEFEFTESLARADLLYAVYGPGITKNTLKYWLFTNKPILIHWIGKDTFILNKKLIPETFRGKVSEGIKKILLKYKNTFGKIKYISSAPWLAKEVQEFSGVETDYLVLTSIELETLLTPEKNRKYEFVTYIPVNDFDMYYGHQYLEIVKNNQDKQFCIVCPDLTDLKGWRYEKFDNLTIQTRTDKFGFYNCLNASKTFIRMKNGGDAIALSVLEALVHGCKVVWNLKFDYCEYETRESFLNNYRKYFINDFTVNEEAVQYVKDNYDVEIWKRDFKNLVKQITN